MQVGLYFGRRCSGQMVKATPSHCCKVRPRRGTLLVLWGVAPNPKVLHQDDSDRLVMRILAGWKWAGCGARDGTAATRSLQKVLQTCCKGVPGNMPAVAVAMQNCLRLVRIFRWSGKCRGWSVLMRGWCFRVVQDKRSVPNPC